ncbi:MAG: hypothetical protein QME90_10485 [Thermodesulfobacteriota bacterium]|nr:hypothetical protein [Thermodesulfobacteriota bacterium]
MAEKAWHSIEAPQVLKELNMDPRHGLTEDEAKSDLKHTAIMN